MSALAEGLAGLNSVLSELGEKQVVVQQTRRKWGLPFGSGRK
jgi:hypothetical protein